MKDSHRLVLISVIVFLTLAPAVFGANLLDNVLAPLKGIDIARTYQSYYAVIDAILYFILFIGVASTALGEKFKESKSVPTVIGIMLAIGMLIFEYKSGFNLGKLAPVAIIILFLILGSAIYKYTKDLGGSAVTGIALALALIIILINLVAPAINDWINKTTWASAIKNIILIVCFGVLIGMAAKYIKGIRTGENAFNRAEKETDYAEKREKKIKDKEDKLAQKILTLDEESKQFEEKIKNLETIEAQLENTETMERKNQLQLLQQLEQSLEGTWKFQEGLRRIHNNINNPAYENEKDKIDGYFNTFTQYVDKIKSILISLQKHIQYSKDNSDTKLSGIETEFDKDISQLLDDNIKLAEGISRELEALKDTEIYPELFKEFEQLREQTITSIRSESDVKKNEKNIIKILQKIQKADVKNFNDINHAISVINKYPLTPLSIANRAGRIVTFKLLNENTLKDISDIVKQIKEKLEEIIAVEDSNGENFFKDKDTKMKNISQLQINTNIKYSEFEKKIIIKTKEMYNNVNRAYIEKALELLKIAETLRADNSIDPGMKSNDINNAHIALANFQQSINNSKYKDDRLIKPLIGDAQSLDKMCNTYITKKNGKINSKTQGLLKKFMAGLASEIEKVKKDITTG